MRKEHPENGRLVKLSLTPRKMMEQLILETISRCLKNWKVIKNNQYGFTKEKLINFYDEKTGLVAEGREADTVDQNCSKTFVTVSYKILMKYGLDERRNNWAQTAMAQSLLGDQ